MLPQPLSNSTELICQQAVELQSFGHMKHQIHPFLIPFTVSADWEQVLVYLWEARKGQICTAHVGLAAGAWDLDLDLSSSTPPYAQVGTSRLTLCWGCTSCLLSFAVDHQGAKSYTSGLGLWSTSFLLRCLSVPSLLTSWGLLNTEGQCDLVGDSWERGRSDMYDVQSLQPCLHWEGGKQMLRC